MFGELRSVKIIVNERNIRQNDVFEKGKINKRIKSLIKYLRDQNLNFGYINEGSNNFITLYGNKIAIVRTYSSHSNSVGFSISTDTIMDYPAVAFVFNSNDNNIEKIYLIPKGTKNIPESGKISQNCLRKNNWACGNIANLCNRLIEGGTADGIEL